MFVVARVCSGIRCSPKSELRNDDFPLEVSPAMPIMILVSLSERRNAFNLLSPVITFKAELMQSSRRARIIEALVKSSGIIGTSGERAKILR